MRNTFDGKLRKSLKIWPILSLCLVLPHCATPAQIAALQGKTVYNMHNFRCEQEKGVCMMYTTNYYGVPQLMPFGTAFKVTEVGRKDVRLLGPNKQTVLISFVPKHNLVPFEQWLSQNFSSAKPSLPKDLSPSDVELINQGTFKVGMSRRAFLISMGMPPRVLTPDWHAAALTYEKKRFNKTVFNFDKSDHLIRVDE